MKKGFDIFAAMLILGIMLFAIGMFISLPAHDPIGISVILCAYIVGFLAAGSGFVGAVITGFCILLRKKFKLPDTAEKVIFFITGICGLIFTAVGLFYWFFVAGLPYQDPTDEIQKQWLIANLLGDVFFLCGITAFVGGIVGELVLIYCKKRRLTNE